MVDIISGVEEAKRALSNHESLICGPANGFTAKDSKLAFDPMQALYYRDIEFDIAVTVSTEAQVGGKATGSVGFIKVINASENVDASLNKSDSTVSRVKFHVPVAFGCNKNT